MLMSLGPTIEETNLGNSSHHVCARVPVNWLAFSSESCSDGEFWFTAFIRNICLLYPLHLPGADFYLLRDPGE